MNLKNVKYISIEIGLENGETTSYTLVQPSIQSFEITASIGLPIGIRLSALGNFPPKEWSKDAHQS